MKTQCVIYARVSTNLQDTESQIQDLKKWATYNDYEVSEEFKETITGYDKVKERPALDKLKEYIKTHNIKQVITFELSRLGRSTQQTLTEIKYFTSEGVNLFFKKDNINTISDSGINNLIITILSGIAEMEGVTLKDRVKRGRMLSASKGKRVGFSKMPLGFSCDANGFLFINEEEAILVNKMYEAIASGISAPRLAKDMNAKGIPTYNEKIGRKSILKSGDIISTRWNPKTIKNIIKNTRYKGFRTYGGETQSLPKIVDEELWNEANKKLDDHIGYLSRTKYDYLAKGKITCGQCGYTLKSLRKYSKKGNDVLYYTCQSYLHTNKNCDCGRFRSEVFDKNLYSILFENSGGLRTLISKGSAKQEQEDIKKQIDYWQKQKDLAEKERIRVLSLFKKGFTVEEELEKDYAVIHRKMSEANTEIFKLNNSLKNIDEPKGLTADIMKKYYWYSDFLTKRSFVEEYVQRIKTYKVEKIDFDLTLQKYYFYEDRGDNMISVMKKHGTKQPKKNEVIWYVEIFAFNYPKPIKALMTSATKTNFVKSTLSFNKELRSISILSD
jgi:DNA invertase Pin-like site-specific DNA recombinase